MMGIIISMDEIKEEHKNLIGGKAYSLSQIRGKGFMVPEYLCITTEAYEKFLSSSGLEGRIVLELARKDFDDMRWEEMWDTSLRIRNMFINTPMPKELAAEMTPVVEKKFDDHPVVVRSSAPGEDSSKTSFAGLHESYVNIRGVGSILEHIKWVWASLWSDAALMYRKELGLDIKHSLMAVMVQEIIVGQRSGIVFSKNPNNELQLVIEAVHGLNKGLVDGDVEPDRWILERKKATIVEHTKPERERATRLSNEGTVLEILPPEISESDPLDEKEVRRIYEMAMISEEKFGTPQDMEWTIKDNEIYMLQSRPITTIEDKEKKWYMSLKRTFDNLKRLRAQIEKKLIPEMVSEADSLENIELSGMSDKELADEIIRRRDVFEKWDEIYTRDFIPFAHGMRLFGQVYNDIVKPADPYEFMDLLKSSELVSIQRNSQLRALADMLRNNEMLREKVERNIIEGEFGEALSSFMQKFGSSTYVKSEENILKIVLEIASRPPLEIGTRKDLKLQEKEFLSNFGQEDIEWGRELLDIGRASYRLRDDDNIYIGRIEGQYIRSADEARKRIEKRGIDYDIKEEELLKAIRDRDYIPKRKDIVKEEEQKNVNERQIQGQPAVKGLVTGIARVIEKKDDLFSVRSGEILVCDAIDPNMTFVVPLVGGIVERRGGMLIHGAIIAREYGIPCVTGIPEVTRIIRTGDQVTVDGYLGIVVINRS